MSLRIHSGAPAPVEDSASAQNPSGTSGAQGHHHHHPHHVAQTRKPASRPRAKRRRGADSQDGVDESGASEELLMMLDEHLQKTAETVMRVGERRQGSGGHSGGGQQDDGDRAQNGVAAKRSRTRLLRGGPAGADDVEEAREHAESALLEVRRAQGAAQTEAVTTYEVLAVMRAFLSMPSDTARTLVRLAAIRARLVEAVEKPTGRARTRQQSINLLLPLMLLNLERKRTDGERALALARINSLLGHRRARL